MYGYLFVNFIGHLCNIYVNLNKRIWHMSEKSRQKFHIPFLTPSPQLHCMTRAKLNISKKNLDFYYHSIKVHTQEAQNMHQLKSPSQTQIYLVKIFLNETRFAH